MNKLQQRAENILYKINELATVSEDEMALTRTFGSDAFIEGRNKVEEWMKGAGLETRVDNMGNVRGRLPSKAPGAKTFVIASHIDTVVNAGKFDGPLGVIMGLNIIESLILNRTELPFHLELIAFCDEEGVRYHTTFLGSKVVAGSFDKQWLTRKDALGIELREAIETLGGKVNNLAKDAIARKDWLGYFEIHIEQGPVLYERNIPAALVTAIAGQRRVEVVFTGMAGHAGTVPMDMRYDALCCAAEFILEAERLAKTHKKELVATVGKVNITYAASNVIPGEVICSLDLRSAKENALEMAYNELKEVGSIICLKRSINFQWRLIQETEPVDCDVRLNQLLASSIEEAGYTALSLVSGAGHDAVPISAVSPVCMLLVRCFQGISHHPLESVEAKDIAASLHIAETFIHQLIKKHKEK